MSKPNKPEKPETPKAPAAQEQNPEQSANDVPKTDTPKEPEAKKHFRTLYFQEGFWCKELNRSFQIGHYTPKDEKEAAILEKFDSTEFNNLKPSR